MRSTTLICLLVTLVGTPGIQAQAPDAHPVIPPAAHPAACDTPCCIECDSCAPCGPFAGRFWARGEYLLWWIQGSALPPLVTTSPPGTPQAAAGVLGTAGTTVLFGDERASNNERSGIRLRLGTWLDCEQTCGIEVGGFLLEGQSDTFTAGSVDGSSIVARPFNDARTGLGNAQLVSFPGVLAGMVAAEASSSNFLGLDAISRKAIFCGQCFRLDAIAGYRFLRYDDAVRIAENLTPLLAPFVPGTRIVVRDDFGSQNDFHGAGLGLASAYRRGPWSVEGMTRLNVGKTFREVAINGSTVTAVPGQATVVNTGGLLALASNIGTFRSSDWAVVPEVDLHLGYRLTPQVRLLVGYSFLLWTRVARAGEQFDLTVNPNLFPPAVPPVAGPARPAFSLQTNDMWIQGLSCGLEWRF